MTLYSMAKSLKINQALFVSIVFFAVSMRVMSAEPELSIVTYGDSITAGLIEAYNGTLDADCPPGLAFGSPYGLPSNRLCVGNGIEGVGGYQPELKQQLQELGYDVSIFNHGYSGALTFEMRSDINFYLNQQANADYVLLMGGVNDGFAGASTSTVKFNMQSMVNTICSRGSIPVLTPATKVSFFWVSVRDFVDAYKPAIEEITSNSNGNCPVLAADQYSALSVSGGDLGGDGVHLSSTGNTKMAAEWFKAMAVTELFNGSFMLGIFLLMLDE